MKVKRLGITEIFGKNLAIAKRKKALNLLVYNQLNSSLRHKIVTA